MANRELRALRVLVVDGHPERLRQITESAKKLGHDVIPEIDLGRVGKVTRAQRPDVALVIVGEGSERALQLIDAIVHEATCPVIAVLATQDRKFVEDAAGRGIFAYLTIGDDTDEVQSSIDIVLRRFSEYHGLQGAFERRAVTERAKGVLMERHGVEEREAFEMLRDEARRTNRKIVDVAGAMLGSHRLLTGERAPAPEA